MIHLMNNVHGCLSPGQVAKAGETAIKQIGSVVRNPEIQLIAPVLIDALQNPTKKTSGRSLLGSMRYGLWKTFPLPIVQ